MTSGNRCLTVRAQLGARHLGHPLVGQQHRDRLARQDLQRLAPRRRGDHAEPVLEPQPERVQVARVVVDVEDRRVRNVGERWSRRHHLPDGAPAATA